MERFELENSREFKAAQELEDAWNNMSWNSELRSQWCIITGYSNKNTGIQKGKLALFRL